MQVEPKSWLQKNPQLQLLKLQDMTTEYSSPYPAEYNTAFISAHLLSPASHRGAKMRVDGCRGPGSPLPPASSELSRSSCSLCFKDDKKSFSSFQAVGGGWRGFICLAAGPPCACSLLHPAPGAQSPEATHKGRCYVPLQPPMLPGPHPCASKAKQVIAPLGHDKEQERHFPPKN